MTIAASRPRFRDIHLLGDPRNGSVLKVDGSQLFGLTEEIYTSLAAAADDTEIADHLSALGLAAAPPRITDDAPKGLKVRALSLAIAQSCNLGCTYCYAQGGSFGTEAKAMPLATALASVDLLFAETTRDEPVNLAFLGGEPLVARALLREVTEYAHATAARRGQEVRFSITTNGTLLTPEDAAFFERHGFAVTISLDGPAAVHDRLRPYKNGRGSFATIIDRVRPALDISCRMQVTARVTVTPQNLDLKTTLDELLGLGFYSVGFSPMLASPTGAEELDAGGLDAMLQAMIACGHEFERRALANQPYAFANMMTAMRELHRGTHRPYPCGAGAGYLAVAADGELAACHRFVGSDEGAMGSLGLGVDKERQADWLHQRHVHRQSPCNSCWARYLCGGGCHHEVIARGRPACDYIRGWLHYTLEAYLRLSAARPEMFR